MVPHDEMYRLMLMQQQVSQDSRQRREEEEKIRRYYMQMQQSPYHQLQAMQSQPPVAPATPKTNPLLLLLEKP